MPDIAFMTYIHNGEKTMRKSIESVLNQEGVDLVYYLIDNASTDSTWDIMQEYAAKDDRVRLIQNENSLVKLPEYIKSIKDCEYFAVLDADDWYESAFAREAIAFAREEDLDIVAVGMCINSSDDKIYKKEEKRTILTRGEFKKQSDVIARNFFTAMWGKVFRLSVVQTMNFSRFDRIARRKVFLGADTIFSLSALQTSWKIGILNQVLFQYYIISASDSRRYNPEGLFILSSAIEMWLEIFVNTKEMEQIDFDNYFWITEMYYDGLLRLFRILMESEIDMSDFLNEIRAIAEFPMTEGCMQEHLDLKEFIVELMIDKMEGMENDPEVVQLFYECLKALDAVELFKKMAK